MSTQVAWTCKEIEKLVDMVDKGYCIEDIAKRLSRSKKAISCKKSILFQQGRLVKTQESIPWKQSEIDELKVLRKEGVSQAGIARVLGRKVNSVYSKIRQLEQMNV